MDFDQNDKSLMTLRGLHIKYEPPKKKAQKFVVVVVGGGFRFGPNLGLRHEAGTKLNN